MWNSRLFWKLFLVYAGLILVLAIGFFVVVTSWQRSEVNEQVEQRLHNTAVVLRSHVRQPLSVLLDDNSGAAETVKVKSDLQTLVDWLADETGTRLTLVDGDGTVLADSERDPRTMMNHANRPELIAAGTVGKGTARRASPTLGIDMFYLALPVETDAGNRAYVRVAVELNAMNQRVAAVRRFLWLFSLVLGVVAAGLTYAIVGRIIHPLAQLTQRAQAIASGQDEQPVPVESKDEVGLLAAAFNQMQLELARRVRQLRYKNEQMATVLSNMEEGIIALDADQNIVLANDASKSLLGFGPDDEIGRPLLAAVRSRALQKIVQQSLTIGRSVQTEFESTSHPRRELAVRATCLPGDPAPGVVVVLHDITELRRLENLRHELVANVSHELKTPLSAIKAYAETLRLGAVNDSENNLHFVAGIEEQADRLHQLILDMLQVARIEAGEEALEITVVPVHDVVDACIFHHGEATQRKRITLDVQPPDPAIRAAADEDALRTILDNLVDNAIKYTPEGGRVTVRWRAEGTFVVLEVEDTGIGISEPDQVRVFERFFRADKARSRELGGTGLGLSIVKHLSQALGGSVVLESQPGTGSTFRVRLPLA